MSDMKHDKVFLAQIKSELDAGVDQLGPAIQARLRASRQQATALAEQKRSWFFVVPRWVTASTLATVVVAAFATSLWVTNQRRTAPDRPMEEIELLTAQGQLEMYEELEFYRWLAETRDSR